jgi:hypothetical protein
MSQFCITGRIINYQTHKEFPRLRVEAWQNDRASPTFRANHRQLTARRSPRPEFAQSKTGM